MAEASRAEEAAALASERELSASLAEAARSLQWRARAQRTLLTLELVRADDDLCAARAVASLQAASAGRLQAQLAEKRAMLEAFRASADRAGLTEDALKRIRRESVLG